MSFMTPIQMRMFSQGRDRSEAIKRRFTGFRYWLLWPLQRYLIELSAIFWLLDRVLGTDLGQGFWAWIAPTRRRLDQGASDEVVDLVDDF